MISEHSMAYLCGKFFPASAVQFLSGSPHLVCLVDLQLPLSDCTTFGKVLAKLSTCWQHADRTYMVDNILLQDPGCDYVNNGVARLAYSIL